MNQDLALRYINRVYNNDSNVTLSDRIITGLILPISPVNILLIFVIIPLVVVDGKRYHHNMVVLRFQVIFSFVCVVLGRFISIILMWIEDRQPPLGTFMLWWYAILVSNYGPDLLRCCWVAICCERVIATYLKNDYEKMDLSFIWIILSVLMHFISLFTGYAKFYLWWTDFTIFGLNFSIDVLGFVGVVLLYYYNQYLLKIKYKLRLSERYQVDENMRILKFTLPYLISGMGLTIFNSVSRVCSTQIRGFAWFLPRTIGLFYLVFNIYIFIGLFYWIQRMSKENRKIQKIVWRILNCICGEKWNRITPANSSQAEKSKNENIDTHFAMLQKNWA